MKNGIRKYIDVEEVLALKNTFGVSSDEFQTLYEQTEDSVKILEFDVNLKRIEDRVSEIDTNYQKVKIKKGTLYIFTLGIGGLVLFLIYKYLLSIINDIDNNNFMFWFIFLAYGIGQIIVIIDYIIGPFLLLQRRRSLLVQQEYLQNEKQAQRYWELYGIIVNKYERKNGGDNGRNNRT